MKFGKISGEPMICEIVVAALPLQRGATPRGQFPNLACPARDANRAAPVQVLPESTQPARSFSKPTEFDETPTHYRRANAPFQTLCTTARYAQ